MDLVPQEHIRKEMPVSEPAVAVDSEKDDFEEIIEVIEEHSAVYGSEGLADPEEVTLEKSVEKVRNQPKADMVCFDREAFYRRQGVYDKKEEQVVLIER